MVLYCGIHISIDTLFVLKDCLPLSPNIQISMFSSVKIQVEYSYYSWIFTFRFFHNMLKYFQVSQSILQLGHRLSLKKVSLLTIGYSELLSALHVFHHDYHLCSIWAIGDNSGVLTDARTHPTFWTEGQFVQG